MGSSVPAALDYLALHIPKLSAVTALKAAFSDGWPGAGGKADTMVVLAGTPDADAQSIGQTYAMLSNNEHEDVSIVSTIWVRRVGLKMASTARRDAYGILDAINELIRSDRNLGKAIIPGTPARISQIRTTPTPNAKSAGTGRTCELRWTLTWQHRT